MSFAGWEVEEKLLAKQWEIDCIDITLTQNATPNPHQYRGKGHLRQEADGVVTFRLYLPNDYIKESQIELGSSNDAGMLVPRDAYYTLAATDWYARVWTCNRVHPDISTTDAGGRLSSVISGKATYLQTTEDIPELDWYAVRLVWLGTFDIPANCATETVKTVGNRNPIRSWSRNVALFKNDLGEFVIRAEPGRLVLTCESSQAQHPNFVERIAEALGFVVGRRLPWNYSEEYRDKSRITRARTQEQSDELALPVPAGGVSRDHAGYTWVIFSRFLQFIASHEGNERPPVSRHIYGVLQGYQGTIGAYALSLGIAVEGLCTDLFPPSVEYDTRFRRWVKDLKKHCLAWGSFSDPEAYAALYDRVGGMIGTLHSTRPKDTLHRLASAGAVKAELAAAWGKLRNATAHANIKATGTLQELVTLCDQVVVLLYQLVFKAIGYEGIYTDYSQRGYPEKRYRGRPVTKEELAVAAYFLWLAEGKKDGNDLAHWYKARSMLEAGLI